MSTFLADSLRDIRRLCDLAHSVLLCSVRNRLLLSLQFIRIDHVSSFGVIIEQFHNSSFDKVPVANS